MDVPLQQLPGKNFLTTQIKIHPFFKKSTDIWEAKSFSDPKKQLKPFLSTNCALKNPPNHLFVKKSGLTFNVLITCLNLKKNLKIMLCYGTCSKINYNGYGPKNALFS